MRKCHECLCRSCSKWRLHCANAERSLGFWGSDALGIRICGESRRYWQLYRLPAPSTSYALHVFISGLLPPPMQVYHYYGAGFILWEISSYFVHFR